MWLKNQKKEIKINYPCEKKIKKMEGYMADSKDVTLYKFSFNYFSFRNNMMGNIILYFIADFLKEDRKDGTIVTGF